MTKKITKNIMSEAKGLSGLLGFLGSGKTMFSGMNLNVGLGQKAIIKGSPVKMAGHEPPAKFAQLSDGSKLVLMGKNKGMRIK